MTESEYDPGETKFLIDGFRYGFQLEYQGERNTKRMAPNLKLECGSKEVLWEKMMKEVKLKHFAGSFRQPPFKNFIQSLIGLVPKI